MKTETLVLVLGAAAAVGAGYYFLVYKPKQAALTALPAGQNAPTFPTGQPPVQAPQVPLPNTGLPAGFPTGMPAPTPVTVTKAFQAADLNTGMYKNFVPGDQVFVYGTPIAGITTLTDSTSHLYTTQSVVAGNLAHMAGQGSNPNWRKRGAGATSPRMA